MKISRLTDPLYLVDAATAARSLADKRESQEVIAKDPQKFVDKLVEKWPARDREDQAALSNLREIARDLQPIVSSSEYPEQALRNFASAATLVAAALIGQGIGPAIAETLPRFRDPKYTEALGKLAVNSDSYSVPRDLRADGYFRDPAAAAKLLSSAASGSGEAAEKPDYQNMSRDLHHILLFSSDWNSSLRQFAVFLAEVTSALTGQGMGEALAKSVVSPEALKTELGKLLMMGKKGAVIFPPKPKIETPTLDQYGLDLTARAGEGKLDPVLGRTKEIKRVIQILSRRTKNNPVLIGEPGVGKTAVVEGLAQMIKAGDIPKSLKGKRIVSLELGSLVAGTKFRGEFEERLQKVLKEVAASNGEIILFVDEMHNLVGAGDAQGALDASNIMKPLLARGDIQCIGATTLDEYRKRVEKDGALKRRFQPVMIPEPGVDETTSILKRLKTRYEAHHQVTYTDKALQSAAEMAHRYLTDRFLPDSAIDLMDEAGARLAILPESPELLRVEGRIQALRGKAMDITAGGKFERLSALGKREEQLEALRDKILAKNKTVGEDDIASVISEWTGIPASRLCEEESKKLLGMEDALHQRVVSQHEAISAVSDAVRRARAGLKDPKRPTGSFIFAGPTGVGKTELAKALAEYLFNDENAMVRIDMSEYMEKHSVSRLIGSPPGYVGHDEGGQLTEPVRRKPYSVILLDEIEKAHPDVFDVLLQVLDDGRLTDSSGRTVDFKNTIIIMTTNLGNKSGIRGSLNEEEAEADYAKNKDATMEAIKGHFRPEFLNRVDDSIVFQPLYKKDMNEIVEHMLGDVAKLVRGQARGFEVTPAAKELLVEKGFDPVYGARPLKRAIQKMVEDPLARKLIQGEFAKGETIIVDSDGTELGFRKKSEEAKAA